MNAVPVQYVILRQIFWGIDILYEIVILCLVHHSSTLVTDKALLSGACTQNLLKAKILDLHLNILQNMLV